MQLLITDVTEMGGGNHCVAGWNAVAQAMVRPLPSGGNWPTALIAQHDIRPGKLIQVFATGNAPTGAYPHRTEDLPIHAASIQLIQAGPPNWLDPAAPHRAATVDAAFGGHIAVNREWDGRLLGAHVPSGVQSRSLWGLELERNALAFVTDYDKLKAVVDDGDNVYMISVSARDLKAAYRAGGIDAVEALLPHGGRLHVRLGLARAWQAHPDKCYVMVNGVYS